MAGTTRKDELAATLRAGGTVILDAGELGELSRAAKEHGGDPAAKDHASDPDEQQAWEDAAPGAQSKPKPRARTTGHTDAVKAEVRKLARGGMSRNAIARQMGISAGSVSNICRTADPPISFDRAATQQAVLAKTVDQKSQRADLAQDALGEVRRLFGLLTAQHEVFHWDKDGFMHRDLLERPTSGDVKNYVTSIGILLDKHAMLIKFDSDDRDLPAVDLFLAEISGGKLA